MDLKDIKEFLPVEVFSVLESVGVGVLRPVQEKAIRAGLLEGRSLLVCTPTSSGKTLVGELACVCSVVKKGGKVVYVVPLKALASEKFRDFSERYGSFLRVGLSVGDVDSSDAFLRVYDFVVCTSEKLDSLIRHRVGWLSEVRVLVVDEVHYLNDVGRGPVLEVVVSMMRDLCRDLQVVALSATVGNPDVIASWLGAGLVVDGWRPVRLHKGVCIDDDLSFLK